MRNLTIDDLGGPADARPVKWSFGTRRVPNRPMTIDPSHARLAPIDRAPRANDVIVAEVLEIGRHTRLELHDRRRATLFPGDLIGVVYGHRYATRQFEGVVPAHGDRCHLMSVGGVCGEVVGKPVDFRLPTTIRPLGHLLDEKGDPVHLGDCALRPVAPVGRRPETVLVVGSAMDSGKKTSAYSIVFGLGATGRRVGAAKITGTAASKDTSLFEDAGAASVLDFTDAGHVSTAECTPRELAQIYETLTSHLTQEDVDTIVLEIADGVVQRETTMLLAHLGARGCIDAVVYACNDSLGIRNGIELIERHGLDVRVVSGCVAATPLSTQEAQRQSPLPVLGRDELLAPAVADHLFGSTESTVVVPGGLALQTR